MPQEIITRRNLPHWYVPGATFFVTFRLEGSLPQDVLERLRQEREREVGVLAQRNAPPAERYRVGKQWFARYDAELDRGQGPTHLSQTSVAALIRRSLYFLHGKQYHLLAYCVMPNHVHALFQPLDRPEAVAGDTEAAGEVSDDLSPLARIMHSLKSYTAHRSNELLNRSGAFWQGESYDHWVRDDDELGRIIAYIAANPVKAGLARSPHDWYFCSAHDRYLHDGSECAWLDLPATRTTTT